MDALQSIELNRSRLEARAIEVFDVCSEQVCFPYAAKAGMDNDNTGQGLGLAVLVALCSSLIERSCKGGLIIAGALNLGGSVEMIPNAVAVAELAVEKGATTLLMPIAARRQLFDLPDDMATKINIDFYADAADAFLKAIIE